MLRISLRRCLAPRGTRRPSSTLLGTHCSTFNPDVVLATYYDSWQQTPDHKYCGMSKERIRDWWKRLREEAIHEGNLLHAAIKADFDGTEINYDTDRDEWKQFLAFQEEYNLTAHRTEMIVHECGMSIDLIVKNSDGTYSIYDWKRCKDPIRKGGNRYYQYSRQLNVYREELERNFGYKVKSMHIVRFHPNASSFEVTDVERTEIDERRSAKTTSRVYITQRPCYVASLLVLFRMMVRPKRRTPR